MIQDNLAPIIIFTYKRLETLKKTILALQSNELALYSELYIFSDAAKTIDDVPVVESVRDYIKNISGFKKVNIFEASENKGLANSIISGVNQLFELYDRVIVLEDDLVTTTNFISFMNKSLIKYQYNEKVFSISGYSFSLRGNIKGNYDIYFLNRGWSWGWATWKDRWIGVDWNVTDYPLFVENKVARREFALGGSDLNKMLDEQMAGKLDSWAIRWFYHQFKVKGLTAYPILSKVFNDGFDKDATHTTGSSKRYIPIIDTQLKTTFCFPDSVELSSSYQASFQKKMSIQSRIVSKIYSFFKLMAN